MSLIQNCQPQVVEAIAAADPAAWDSLAQRLRARPTFVEVEGAGRAWHIAAVEDQDALLEGVETLDRPPYGLMLWESAVALAQWLAANSSRLRGATVLELGAGAGLPGLVARWLGAEVCQTDHEPRALELARFNSQCNQVAGIELMLADWRQWNHERLYQFIIGADILYERACQPYLAAILERNLAPGGTVAIADPVRRQALDFVADLERGAWRVELEVQHIRLHERARRVETALFVLKRSAVVS